MSDLATLVAGLVDYRERAAAMKSLLLAGASAVDALVGALEHPVENVRWAAATVLGQIGEPRALEALERVPPTGAPGEAAREAIATIRASASSDEAIVRALAAEPSVAARGQGSKWLLRVAFPDGRRQKVRLELDGRDRDGEPVVGLLTPCGPATPARHEAVLRANLGLRAGAFAVVDIEGQPHYVAVASHRRAGLDLAALERSLHAIASAADALEKQLAELDRF